MPPETFEPLYYPDRLNVVNPDGDVGVLTLWTPPKAAKRLLEQAPGGVLDPKSSRVAAWSNLYGDGLYAMFCNLLNNPQIRHLVAIGQDMGLSVCREIDMFLRDGCEDTTLLGRPMRRVRGTDRFFPADPAFDEDRLRHQLSFRYLGQFSTETADGLAGHLAGLPSEGPDGERVRVELDVDVGEEFAYRPSDPGGHHVARRSALDCWEELVVRVLRFGRPRMLADGPRLELRNAKAVISAPRRDREADLAEYGFSVEAINAYEAAVLSGDLAPGVTYSYGHRLRSHFGMDALEVVSRLLKNDPESRSGFISLWDTMADLRDDEPDEGSKPCWATAYFRRTDEGRLSVTATYRSHNLLSAWLQNAYGLMAVQRYIAERTGMPAGPITVVSHSLGADPRSPRFALARDIAARWSSDDDRDRGGGGHVLREDPHGYFRVTVDKAQGLIVAEHLYQGVVIKQYRANRGSRIEQQIAADMAVSVPSHAMWLGRELARHEQILRS